jgi:hypothetical protein
VSALRTSHPGVEAYDLHYLRFVADPIGEIKGLYRFLEQRLPVAVEQKMRAALAAHNMRRAQIGPNRYNLAQYGLSVDGLPSIFTEYIEQFGIEREPN